MGKEKKKASTREDYTKLWKQAYDYVVVKGKTQKFTSEVLGVSEKTLSDWAQKGDWRNLRRARQSAVSTTNENIRQIIALLSEKRLELEHDITRAEEVGDRELELKLRKEANAISDDLSKQNKTLRDNSDKKNEITLGLYLDVMDDVFNELRSYKETLFDETIDFQVQLVRKKTLELG